MHRPETPSALAPSNPKHAPLAAPPRIQPRPAILSSPSQHTVAVVNGQAGGGAMRRVWPRMLAELVRLIRGRLSVEWTSSPEAATSITRSALRSGADRILAVGGDGTVHEVVNGFFEPGPSGTTATPIHPDAVFGHLPCGTGGDFRRALGIPAGVAATGCLRTTRVRPVDLVRVTCRTPGGDTASRIVANVASCGLGGLVVQTVRRLPSQIGAQLGPAGGTLAYFAAILTSLATYTSDRLQVRVDGRDAGTVDVRTVAVANGSSFGGGLRIAPQAVVDDGLLDAVLLRNVSAGYLITRAHRFYAGSHLSLPAVQTVRGRRIELAPIAPSASTHAPPIWLEGDGELLGCLPATFEVLPGALRVQC